MLLASDTGMPADAGADIRARRFAACRTATPNGADCQGIGLSKFAAQLRRLSLCRAAQSRLPAAQQGSSRADVLLSPLRRQRLVQDSRRCGAGRVRKAAPVA